MSQWYGAARTNEVSIIDMQGLKNSLKDVDIQIKERGKNTVVFLPSNDSDGDFSYSFIDENGDDIEFNWESFVMPYVAENEVLIVMCSGAEKLRYITGDAQAYIRRGDNVEAISISLTDIYEKAINQFNVESVKPCEY